MASNWRLLMVVLLLFFLVVSSTGVHASRSLKSFDEEGLFGHFQNLDVEDINNDGTLVKIEGRMNIELTDYPGTGANRNHDPVPGRRG